MKHTSFLILLILQCTSLFSQVSSVGLQAYYPFTGNANDASGNANHGTVNGAALTSDRFGIANQAYSFDGINDFISINHNAGFNFSSYTISVWFKYNGPGTSGKSIWTILAKNSTGNGNQDPFQIWLVAATKIPGGRIADGSVNIEYSNPPALNDGQWHQAVSVFNNASNSLRQYIDGILISSNGFAGNPYTNTSLVSIGVWTDFGNYFNGAIDDVRFYNRALSMNEVSQLYQSENASSNYSFMTIKCFIEGYYIAPNLMQNVLYNQGVETIPSNHCDSITVELIGISGAGKYYAYKSILNTNGNIQFGFPTILPTGLYQFLITPRGGLRTYSTMIQPTAGASYNFSNNMDIYQQDMGSGIYAIYSGDLNGDLNIDLLDLQLLETSVNNFLSDYHAHDLNGDGNVDLLDLPIMENNVADFVGNPD